MMQENASCANVSTSSELSPTPPLDFRAAEQLARLGVLPRDLDHRRVKLNRDRRDRTCAPPESRCSPSPSTYRAPARRTRRFDLVERVAVRVDVLDAVHRESGDQQGRRAGRRHQRAVAVGRARRMPEFCGSRRFRGRSSLSRRRRSARRRPTSAVRRRESVTPASSSATLDRRQAEIGRKRSAGSRCAAQLEQRLDLKMRQDDHWTRTRAFSVAQ